MSIGEHCPTLLHMHTRTCMCRALCGLLATPIVQRQGYPMMGSLGDCAFVFELSMSKQWMSWEDRNGQRHADHIPVPCSAHSNNSNQSGQHMPLRKIHLPVLLGCVPERNAHMLAECLRLHAHTTHIVLGGHRDLDKGGGLTFPNGVSSSSIVMNSFIHC